MFKWLEEFMFMAEFIEIQGYYGWGEGSGSL